MDCAFRFFSSGFPKEETLQRHDDVRFIARNEGKLLPSWLVASKRN